LAAILRDRVAKIAEHTLTPGSGGVFDVSVDGKVIFSKHEQGRFPDAAEIEKLIGGA